MGDFALWEAFGSVQNDRQVLGLIFKHRKDNLQLIIPEIVNGPLIALYWQSMKNSDFSELRG